MNQPEPIYPGGPGQRAVQDERKKAAAKGSKSAQAQLAAAAASHGASLSHGAKMGQGREGGKKAKKTAAPTASRPSRKALPEDGPRNLPQGGALSRHGSAPSGRVPLTFLKNIFGVFLLPLAWVWSVSFAGLLGDETVRHHFWITEDFWFFSLGLVLWLLAFTGGLYWQGEPPFLKMYVRFHEWTHAIWTWQSNGRVGEIIINDDHGYVLTNKPTVLVTLAPYFYPLPCIVLAILYLPVHLLWHPEKVVLLSLKGEAFSAVGLFVLLMGVGWGFHFTYTVWMIRKGQSDLRMHGNLFSLVVIYLVNLACVTGFFLLAAPHVNAARFCSVFLHNAEEFSEFAWVLLVKIWVAAAGR